MVSGRVARAVLCAAVPALLATGCASQVAALAPVGGDGLASLRTAATDVLLAQGRDILQAPVCTRAAAGYTCAGALADGAAIGVTSPIDLSVMTITVGEQQVFSGSVADVLQAAAEGRSPLGGAQ